MAWLFRCLKVSRLSCSSRLSRLSHQNVSQPPQRRFTTDVQEDGDYFKDGSDHDALFARVELAWNF